jgi:hypothetical protein
MKTILLTVSILIVLSSLAFAQEYPKPLLAPGQSQVAGGLGISWINGEPYYMIGVMPDLQFGPLGVGLDLTLRIDSKTGAIRKVDWSDGAYRKIIRYLSWGQKNDPLYAQVGQLPMATLGHGFIMYDYNNSASFDDRRIGAELDVDFTKYGFEAIYGDFQTPGVMGGRAYVRPLKFTPLGMLPVIGGFELGATYVTDQNKNSNMFPAIGETVNPDSLVPESKGLMSEYGWDAGLPVLHIPFVDVDLYYDYAQILHFGHGNALGILGTFHSLGIVTASAKLEHLWIGDEFIPEYFDQFYELDRYNPGNFPGYVSKAEQLDSVKESSGWFGQITIAVLGKFQIIGDYRGIDHDPQGGLLHLETQFPNVIPILTFSAGYDRHTNNTIGDVFKLDPRSLLYAFLGYKPYPFMTVGLNYYWTFVPENGTYQVQKRIEPRVMFNFSF